MLINNLQQMSKSKYKNVKSFYYLKNTLLLLIPRVFYRLKLKSELNRLNQYDKEYGGTLKMAEDIRSGVTVDGYVLVEALPKNVRDLTVVFELGYDQYYNYHTFEYNVRLR